MADWPSVRCCLLASWGAYLLARELGASCGGAFVGGLIFGFFPQHVEQSLEHVNLASYQAMPFFLLFLLRMAYSGGRGNTVGCGVFFALNALYSWHNGLMIVPFGLILFAHALAQSERDAKRILVDCVLAAVVASLIVLPFLWPKISEILGGADYFRKPSVKKGVDALFFFLPVPNQPLWGGLMAPLYDNLRRYASVGFVCYLGWSTILLVALTTPLFGRWFSCAQRQEGEEGYGARPSKTRRAFTVSLWIGIAAIYLLLAMGDTLVVAGYNTGIPLPHTLLRRVAGFETLRVANRFVVPAMLALAIVAAMGATRLLTQPVLSLYPRRSLFVLSALCLVDLAWFPYPTRQVPTPEWPSVVEAKYPGLVLNIPGGYRARGADDLFFQTLHRQPIVGGYVSCVLPEVKARVAELPFLQLIFEGRPTVDVEVRQGLKQALGTLHVDTIVLHLDRQRERLRALRDAKAGLPVARIYNPEKGIPEKLLAEIRAALIDAWGSPVYSDSQVELYRNPER